MTDAGNTTLAGADNLQAQRSMVICKHGCTGSSQPLASQIGLDVLKKGGNAADAAVAMAAALNVLQPCSTGNSSIELSSVTKHGVLKISFQFVNYYEQQALEAMHSAYSMITTRKLYKR